MRSWIAIALLAGCYRPSESLTCGTAACALEDGASDSPLDGTSDGLPGDAQLTSCVDSTFQAAEFANVSGTSYSRNVSSLAMFIDPADELQQIIMPGAMAFPVVFITPPALPVTRPVLASSTQNAEVHAFFIEGNSLLRSTFQNGNTWKTPIALTTTGVTIDASFVFGQPTSTTPRRALAGRNGMAFEGVEAGSAWTFVPITIPGVTSVREPSLSRDGLVAVFVSTDSNGMVRMFIAQRATVTASFETALPLPEQPTGTAGTEQFPRFGPDCDHIFVSLDQFVIDVH